MATVYSEVHDISGSSHLDPRHSRKQTQIGRKNTFCVKWEDDYELWIEMYVEEAVMVCCKVL